MHVMHLKSNSWNWHVIWAYVVNVCLHRRHIISLDYCKLFYNWRRWGETKQVVYKKHFVALCIQLAGRQIFRRTSGGKISVVFVLVQGWWFNVQSFLLSFHCGFCLHNLNLCLFSSFKVLLTTESLNAWGKQNFH